MATISHYASMRSHLSALLTLPTPTQIPTLDDLLVLQDELKALHAKSSARSVKAASDIKELEGLWLRTKEIRKDKKAANGAVKVKSKVKREESGELIMRSQA
jgi:hypothetical protein